MESVQRSDVSKDEMSKSIPRIIAVDFDGTLVEDKFPEVGKIIANTWLRVKEEQSKGSKIILWTCRDGKNLTEAVEFCDSYGLTFDAINCNIKETQELFNNDTRKVFADEYWDDKANPEFILRRR